MSEKVKVVENGEDTGQNGHIKDEMDKDKIKDENNNSEKEFKFRNYVPNDPGLRKLLVGSKPVEDAENVIKQVLADFDKEVEEFYRSQESEEAQALLPEKPNADLKRMLEPRMKVLQRQTQQAVAKMVNENLEDGESDEYEESDEESSSVEEKAEISPH